MELDYPSGPSFEIVGRGGGGEGKTQAAGYHRIGNFSDQPCLDPAKLRIR
jgi:hypothetical protein